MELKVNHHKLMFWLCSIALLLVLVHCAWLTAYFIIDDTKVLDFSRLIDLDYEGNIPTLYSSMLFMFNSILLFLLAKFWNDQSLKGAGYWMGLACIFLFLGVDEGTRLHEEIGDIFESYVDAEGALFFPWVIPYVTVLAILVLFYFKFYLSLERGLQIRLFIAATLFIGGAVGVEMLSAQQADLHGTSSLSYSILYTIEESLEFAGLLFLSHTLLKYLANNRRIVQISF